jgi:hypothetical protein
MPAWSASWRRSAICPSPASVALPLGALRGMNELGNLLALLPEKREP